MRKLLKVLIICFIIIIIILLILLNKYSVKTNTEVKNNTTNIIQQTKPIQTVDNITGDIKEDIGYDNSNTTKFEILKNRKQYIIVEDIVINILEEMRDCNSDELIKAKYGIEGPELIDKEKQEILKSLEDKINNNSSLEELFNSVMFKNTIMKESYLINKIYKSEVNSNITVFLIYGQFSNNVEYAFMISMDNANSIFEVYLNDYIEENNYKLSNINNIKVKVEQITKNKNYIIKNYDEKDADEQIAERYLLITKSKMQNSPEEIYNLLDNAYKRKFQNLENFINFAKNAQLGKLKEYKVVDKGQYSEVICRDELGNCIFFKERSVMDYTIVLDPYTIELDTLISEYNSVDKEKVLLNIEKIAQMINMRDYEEIYKRLNETFRNNNFPNVGMLKEYFKSNFYERSIIEFISKEQNDTYYAVRVRIINESNKKQRKLGTIVIKLGEGTDFEMSFSIDQ